MDEELTYKKISNENIHINFSKVDLKPMHSFQNLCVHFVGEGD
jgi:hypothetical protein